MPNRVAKNAAFVACLLCSFSSGCPSLMVQHGTIVIIVFEPNRVLVAAESRRRTVPHPTDKPAFCTHLQYYVRRNSY
jgi:hypothetical protein